MRTGSSADRESTTPAISEVEIKKEMDIASGNLLQKFLTNEAQTVNLDFLRTDDQVDVYCHITLTNAILSMFELESTGERPIEVLRLNFTKIEIRTTQMGPDGLPAAPFTTGYDLGLTKAF
jgi:type VI secretion system secreted protein Hcp